MNLFRAAFYFCIVSFFFTCDQIENDHLDVMTWNIWHGGKHGTRDNDFKEDTLNTRNTLLVLEQNQSDILLMQETYCCGMEIALKAGYEYSWRSSSNLSIHSRHPIIDTINFSMPFNAQGVVVDVNDHQFLVINIWLNYLPNTFESSKTLPPDSLIQSEMPTRVREIRLILNEIDSVNQKYNLPVIIGGDFNSASHIDWVVETKDFHYGKVVQWQVSKVMENKQYVDSYRIVNADLLKTLEGTWGYLNENLISDRIDYIYFRSEVLRPIASDIIMDDPEGGFFNSDHRAVLTKFEILK